MQSSFEEIYFFIGESDTSRNIPIFKKYTTKQREKDILQNLMCLTSLRLIVRQRVLRSRLLHLNPHTQCFVFYLAQNNHRKGFSKHFAWKSLLCIYNEYNLSVGADSISLALRSKFAKQTLHPPVFCMAGGRTPPLRKNMIVYICRDRRPLRSSASRFHAKVTSRIPDIFYYRVKLCGGF